MLFVLFVALLNVTLLPHLHSNTTKTPEPLQGLGFDCFLRMIALELE